MSTVVLLTAAGLVAAPALAPAASARVGAQVPSEESPIVTVHVRDNVFAPSSLSVAKGTTVRWVNDGANRHNVTPAVGSAFGSGDLRPGTSYVHTFREGGSFAYYCTLHGTPTKGQHADLEVGNAASSAPTDRVGEGPHDAPVIRASGRTIRVPADAKTIQGAVDRARQGDLVLVSPGVYHESVTIGTSGIVLRGRDRNTTVLDGDFRRANGVFVVGADGVAIENLTARNFTENGFFWSGVLGYRASYLTAYRNGDYGIYVYDSQYGQFDHSYASGSPDSGFYIGQCDPCHAVVTDVVAEYNQIGYSGTNSSGDLFLVRSVWRRNRAGIVPNSLDSDALAPQGRATIAGNVVTENGDGGAARTDSSLFDVVFGAGIVVIGGVGNLITHNRVVGNTTIGIGLAPNPGFGQNVYPVRGNVVTDNVVQSSGLADLAVILFDATGGNCFSGNQYATTAPTGLEQLQPCVGPPGGGDPTAGALDIGRFLDPSANPPGTSPRRTPRPRRQRNLPQAATARARPAGAPLAIAVGTIALPRG